MTQDQAYMVWKCTGRADPDQAGEFRKRRAGELAVEKLMRIASGKTEKE